MPQSVARRLTTPRRAEMTLPAATNAAAGEAQAAKDVCGAAGACEAEHRGPAPSALPRLTGLWPRCARWPGGCAFCCVPVGSMRRRKKARPNAHSLSKTLAANSGCKAAWGSSAGRCAGFWKEERRQHPLMQEQSQSNFSVDESRIALGSLKEEGKGPA